MDLDFLARTAARDVPLLSVAGDPGTLDGRAVRGVFASEFQGPRLGGVPTDLVEPTYYLPVPDIGISGRGSILHIAATINEDYEVVRVEPDGSGWAYLVLRRM